MKSYIFAHLVSWNYIFIEVAKKTAKNMWKAINDALFLHR